MPNMNLSKKAVRNLAIELEQYKKEFETSIEKSKDALLELGSSFQDERYQDFKRSYENIESAMENIVKNHGKASVRLSEIHEILPK